MRRATAYLSHAHITTQNGVSINGNKNKTTSRDGMLHTNDAKRSLYLSTQPRRPPAHYENTEVGYNYFVSILLVAAKRVQLNFLDSMIARPLALRDSYREIFQDIDGIKIFFGADYANDNYWIPSILINSFKPGWLASLLPVALTETNIETQPLCKPVHHQPVFADALAALMGASQKLFENELTIPRGSALFASDIPRAFGVVHTFFGSSE
jgi:dTDP-4-amino-4,6-dideoxygalactose transaminase